VNEAKPHSGTAPWIVENAYRRGFDQGVYFALKAMEDGATPAQLAEWKGRIGEWRAVCRRSLSDRPVPSVNPPVIRESRP